MINGVKYIPHLRRDKKKRGVKAKQGKGPSRGLLHIFLRFSLVASSRVHLGGEDGDELGEGQTDRGRGHEPRVRVVEAGLGGDLLGVVAAHAVQGVGQALAGEI